MEVIKETLSVKDMAELSGLTRRTIQYYDNEGILKAAGRDEHGRRYYTQEQLYILEQITFYRHSGISLADIKQLVIRDDSSTSLQTILQQQENVLYSQLESIQSKIDGVSVSQEMLTHGYQPPWDLLSKLMSSLNEVDVTHWTRYPFSENQKNQFDKVFESNHQALEFYNQFRKLLIKASAYQAAHVPVRSKLTKQLADDWMSMVQQVTNGNPEIEKAFLQVDQDRLNWDASEHQLMKEGEPYLERVLTIYSEE